MSRKELQLLKEAMRKHAEECNTPEKAIEHLKRIGYLDSDGNVAQLVK